MEDGVWGSEAVCVVVVVCEKEHGVGLFFRRAHVRHVCPHTT